MVTPKHLRNIALVMVLILLFALQRCQLNRKHSKAMDKVMEATTLKQMAFSQERDSMGRALGSQRALVLEQKQLLNLKDHQLGQFKQAIAGVRANQRFLIKALEARYLDSPQIKIVVDTVAQVPDTSIYLRTPARFAFKDPHLYLKGTVLPGLTLIDTLQLLSELQIGLGYVRQGFLRKSKPELRILSTNPYSTFTRLETVVSGKPRPPFHKRPSTAMVLGIVVGGLAYRWVEQNSGR